MTPGLSLQDTVTSTLIAAAIGFLIGRTRESGDTAGKPGIRDFVVLSLLGAVAGILGEVAIACVIGGLVTILMAVLRFQHPERTGITSEFSALVTYFLGYLCLSSHLQIAAAIGILLTLILASKEELHSFALRTISEREFGDTVKFLALIFLILPLLPEGSYGPYGFFEPRKVWYFVILVSGVSFVGYFLTRFLDSAKGMVLTAVVGGLASTTAYTGGAAKSVREHPELAVPMSRATILANSIMFPRIYVILVAINPALAQSAAPFLGVMLMVGFLLALPTTRKMTGTGNSHTAFENPFTLLPALRFGAIFTAVLLISALAVHRFGGGGQLIAAGLGGLADVDAVVLSTAAGHKAHALNTAFSVFSILVASAANAVFKAILAFGSGVPAYYVRVAVAFAIMLASGFLAIVTLPIQ